MDDEFSFPILSAQDILKCMNGLQIPCCLEDVNKPNATRLWPIYESFLEYLLGIPSDASLAPHFSILEILENPALHQDSLALMSFYRKVYGIFF